MMALALQFGPYLLAGIVALFGALKWRSSIIKGERAKQAADKLAAAEDRLEMDREATAVERAAARLSDDEARKEALKWAKH
jgi:outer membrane murein-binding lipoprotein Lpp